MARKDPKTKRTYERAYYAGNRVTRMEQVRRYRRTLKGRFTKARNVAKRRQIPWELSFDEFCHLVAPAVCYYCGGRLPEFGCGLDRQDHHLPYAYANCVPCCTECNTRKGHLEFAGLTYPRTVELMHDILSSRRAADGISKVEHAPVTGLSK